MSYQRVQFESNNYKMKRARVGHQNPESKTLFSPQKTFIYYVWNIFLGEIPRICHCGRGQILSQIVTQLLVISFGEQYQPSCLVSLEYKSKQKQSLNNDNVSEYRLQKKMPVDNLRTNRAGPDILGQDTNSSDHTILRN